MCPHTVQVALAIDHVGDARRECGCDHVERRDHSLGRGQPDLGSARDRDVGGGVNSIVPGEGGS